MKLDDYRQSDNVEDRRSSSGGGGGYRPSGRGIRLSPKMALFVLGVIVVARLAGVGGSKSSSTSTPAASSSSASRASPSNDRSKVFVSKVLATTEDAWSERFHSLGKTYSPPRLVLFRDAVPSACGYESAAVGPFYCPRDQKAYLDLTFFDELTSKFGAPGDFAQAYVVAHEIGHHVQKLLGISEKASRQGLTRGEAGSEVRLELQADCFAGVWGAWAQKKGLLETGDVDEALRAAASVGDDTLQKRARGKVSPETFTHGASAQRIRWFKTGMSATNLDACDTFSATSL
jgi:predicted metalloprotease